MHNPYVVGDPVEGNLFVGRENIVGQLKQLYCLSEKLQSVVLLGQQGMGKTSILINAHRYLEPTVRVAYVNLLRLGNCERPGNLSSGNSFAVSQTLGSKMQEGFLVNRS